MGKPKPSTGSVERKGYGELVGDEYVIGSVESILLDLEHLANTYTKEYIRKQLNHACTEARKIQNGFSRASAFCGIENMETRLKKHGLL